MIYYIYIFFNPHTVGKEYNKALDVVLNYKSFLKASSTHFQKKKILFCFHYNLYIIDLPSYNSMFDDHYEKLKERKKILTALYNIYKNKQQRSSLSLKSLHDICWMRHVAKWYK